MRVVAVMVLALLTGCAAQVLSSGPRSVIVKARIQDAGGAQALAEAECQKNGRHARLSMKPDASQYAFDCVN